MNIPEDFPEDILAAIKRQTELQMELRGIEMTNVYGADLEQQVALNARKVQCMRELGIVTGQIQEYIDDGKKPPLGRSWP